MLSSWRRRLLCFAVLFLSWRHVSSCRRVIVEVKEAQPEHISEVSQDPAFINLLQESGDSRMLTVSFHMSTI